MNAKILITIGILIVLLAASGVQVSAGGGGSAKEKTKYFDIIIVPEKPIIEPGEVMKLRIEVKDKETGNPLENAAVTVNMSIYQGAFTEELEIPIENDEGYYEVKQTTIKSVLKPILAKEEGNGIYVIEKKVDTKANLGGVIIKVIVEKDNKVDTVHRVISFMGMNPWVYAIGATLFAVMCGLGIGMIFGGVKH